MVQWDYTRHQWQWNQNLTSRNTRAQLKIETECTSYDDRWVGMGCEFEIGDSPAVIFSSFACAGEINPGLMIIRPIYSRLIRQTDIRRFMVYVLLVSEMVGKY